MRLFISVHQSLPSQTINNRIFFCISSKCRFEALSTQTFFLVLFLPCLLYPLWRLPDQVIFSLVNFLILFQVETLVHVSNLLKHLLSIFKSTDKLFFLILQNFSVLMYIIEPAHQNECRQYLSIETLLKFRGKQTHIFEKA